MPDTSAYASSPELPNPLTASGPVPVGTRYHTALEDSEALLLYAAEAGIPIEPGVVRAVAAAREAVLGGVADRATLVGVLNALTSLSSTLRPVTADTIRACSQEASKSLRRYRLWTVILTACVVVLSFVCFFEAKMSERISATIDQADEAAVALRVKIGPGETSDTGSECDYAKAAVKPDKSGLNGVSEFDLIRSLQLFAAEMRFIYGQAGNLNNLIARWETPPLDPEPSRLANADAERLTQLRKEIRAKLQLDPGLPDIRHATFCKIYTYQDVRNFAQGVIADSKLFYGAVIAYILPIAYALLGALAFRLRDFASEIRARTYQPSFANSARLIASAIAGAILSVFNNFTERVSLSPLAIAFLLGYGVEIFFSLLDTLLRAFRMSEQAVDAQARRMTAATMTVPALQSACAPTSPPERSDSRTPVQELGTTPAPAAVAGALSH